VLVIVLLGVAIPFEGRERRNADDFRSHVQASQEGESLKIHDDQPACDALFNYTVDNVLLGSFSLDHGDVSRTVPLGLSYVETVRDNRLVSIPVRLVPSTKAPRTRTMPRPGSRLPRALPKGAPILIRSVVAHLRYTNPSIEVNVSLPRDDFIAEALVTKHLPLPGFLNYVLGGAYLRSDDDRVPAVVIAYVFPVRASQVYINDKVVVVRAVTTAASTQYAGLTSVLPVREGLVRYGHNRRIDDYLRARYQIVEEHEFTLDEYSVLDTNAANFVTGGRTGEHLVWESAPGAGPSEFQARIRYAPLSSVANVTKFAANNPADLWPQKRPWLEDAFELGRTGAALVFAALVFGRRRVFTAAIVPLVLGVLPIVVLLDVANPTNAVQDRVVAGIGILLICIGALKWRRRRFRVPLLVAGGILVLAAVAPYTWYRHNTLFEPATVPYLVLCALAGAVLSSALVSYFGLLHRPLRSVIALSIVGLSAVAVVPVSVHGIPAWNIVMWDRPVIQDILHDASGWAAWASITVTIVALCAYMGKRRPNYRDTRRALFFFCLTFVDTNIWWLLILPIEVLAAAIVFPFVWLGQADRKRADAYADLGAADRKRFLELRVDALDMRNARNALEALAARFRKGEVSAKEYGKLQHELTYYADSRIGSVSYGDLALQIGPDIDDVSNGRRALWIGLVFGLLDVLIGVPAVVRDAATGTPRSLFVLDAAVQAAATLAVFAVSSFSFGYFFRYWRGRTGLANGLLIGAVLMPAAVLGWYTRGVPPWLLVLFIAETLALYATIGVAFDARTLKATLPSWRFTYLDIARYTGGPQFATLVVALGAALGAGILEALRGGLTTLASVAVGVASTGAAGSHHGL
jgi:hypothetical protein